MFSEDIYSPSNSLKKYENFKPTRLYIKKHSQTGLLYFGKSIREDIYTYKGSGIRWKNHLQIHGSQFVITLWVSDWYHDPKEIEEVALHFSKENDIVNNDIWANLISEDGLYCGGNWCDDEYRKKMIESLNSPETKEKRINTHLENWKDPEFREKMLDYRNKIEAKENHRKATIEAMNTPEMKEKMKKVMEELWCNEEYREKMRNACKTDEARESRRIITTEKWKDPDYREKVLLGINTKENKERHINMMKCRWENESFKQRQHEIRNTKEFKEKISNANKSHWLNDTFREEQTKIRKENWNNEEYSRKVIESINRPEAKEKKRILAEMRRQYAKESTYDGFISKITRDMVDSFFNMGPKIQ